MSVLSLSWFVALSDNPTLSTILSMVAVSAVYYLMVKLDLRRANRAREQEEQRARDHMVSILEDMQRSNRCGNSIADIG